MHRLIHKYVKNGKNLVSFKLKHTNHINLCIFNHAIISNCFSTSSTTDKSFHLTNKINDSDIDHLIPNYKPYTPKTFDFLNKMKQFSNASNIVYQIFLGSTSDEWYSILKVNTKLYNYVKLSTLYLWPIIRRLQKENVPKRYLSHIFEHIWQDLVYRLEYEEGIQQIFLNKNLVKLQEQVYSTLINYDIATNDQDIARMYELLWDTIFDADTSIDVMLLIEVYQYTQELRIFINTIDIDDLLAGNFQFPSPPNGKYVGTFMNNQDEKIINQMFLNVFGTENKVQEALGGKNEFINTNESK